MYFYYQYAFLVLKKIFYIFILVTSFHFSSNAQVKSSFINDEDAVNVKFYPNPAASFINFEFKKNYSKANTLLIFNFIGKKVVELKATDQKMIVPLTDFYRGVYVFQVLDPRGNIIESGKFQVIK